MLVSEHSGSLQEQQVVFLLSHLYPYVLIFETVCHYVVLVGFGLKFLLSMLP